MIAVNEVLPKTLFIIIHRVLIVYLRKRQILFVYMTKTMPYTIQYYLYSEMLNALQLHF